MCIAVNKKLFILLFVFLLPFPVLAGEEPICFREQLKVIVSLSEMPKDITELLGQSGALADAADRFQDADVIYAKDIPTRRYAWAAINARHAIVAVERGGFNYRVEIWRFDKLSGHWQGSMRAEVAFVPESIAALRYALCNSRDIPESEKPHKASIASVYRDAFGNLVLTVHEKSSNPVYQLHFRSDKFGTKLEILKGTAGLPLTGHELEIARAQIQRLSKILTREDLLGVFLAQYGETALR